MRLINTRTLGVEVFDGDSVPRYAILSHTWDYDEASLRGWTEQYGSLLTLTRGGYAKVHMARGQALNDGIEYLWADTVCIDRTSLAEVSEAINAMFAWYRDAYVCYAHLSDVGDSEDDTVADTAEMMSDFSRSWWFTRGWTLQELLAPARVVFYSRFWTRLGTKHDLAGRVARITGIDEQFLHGAPLGQASVAKRMSWMARRRTTRPEDLAYSMMGIFEINMPLLYGEGRKAFMRLQAEIMKQSTDETLFCWSSSDDTPSDWVQLLAPSPSSFASSSRYEPATMAIAQSSYKLTNLGVKISLAITTFWTLHFGVLNVLGPNKAPVGIALEGHPAKGIFWRASFPPGPIELPQTGYCGRTYSTNSGFGGAALSRKDVCILSRMPKSAAATAAMTRSSPHSWMEDRGARSALKYAVMVSFLDRSAVQAIETVPARMFDDRTSVLALQQSTRRRGIYGGIIQLRVPRSRITMRFLLAVNANGRPFCIIITGIV
ncbi:Vegetative incompatibility protein HET-E-1 [Escovopsis weberi]|uniref:Vegetative incompatibility protein HET-E-1 n=1 Tax=Escovopsis weberi TaxID=150374 RepID=A0A0M8N6E8_ESCWE|nr:Vegetative incompatibility protein HET-E-1 [Escovopsis weberi]